MMPFSYVHGNSLLHRLDPRCKLFCICLTSLSMVSARLTICFVYSMIIIFFFNLLKINLSATMARLKYFILLLIFVLAARSLTTEGKVIFSFFSFSITQEGMLSGGLVTFKFLLIMLTGILAARTTKPSAVKGAVQWFFKPVPMINENQLGVMISLSLKFMPMIFKQAGLISDARRARFGDCRKNPIASINTLALPLLKKSFLSADHIADAMASRCYCDDRTEPEFTPSGKEHLFLISTLVLSIAFFWF